MHENQAWGISDFVTPEFLGEDTFMDQGTNARSGSRGKKEAVGAGVSRCPVSFSSDGETLQGWLYLPARIPRKKKLPGIVTANALTGVKEINLPEYATRFAAAGLVVITFDYRYWGGSSGVPRYHISPVEQRADIAHALTFLSRQPEVDPDRIGGWGISMGGGHMLFLATWEPRFKAVVAVSTGISPQTKEDPPSADQAKIRYDGLLAAARDEREGRAAAKLTTLQAWCPEPMAGCALPVKEAYDFYDAARLSFAPTFVNKLTSTSFRNMQADDVAFAMNLAKVPVLILHPDQDVVPVTDVLFHYRRLPEPKRLVVYSGLHTSTYVGGKHLEEAAVESIAWFHKYLIGD